MAKIVGTKMNFRRGAAAAKGRHGTKPLRRSQDLQHQKGEILEKTLRIFTDKGYDGTSVSIVAEGLGMSKANIYYHFCSKENLLYEIHLYFLSKYIIPIVREAEQLVDPQDRIIHFLSKLTYVCLENEGGRLLIHEVGRLNEKHRKEIRKVWQKAYMLMRESIGDLQRLGRAHVFRKSFLSFIGFGMASWVMYWWDYKRETAAHELVETIVDFFLRGLLKSEHK